MKQAFSGEFRKLLKLACPIMAGGVVNSIMPFMNTVYLGRLGETSLAAGGLALSVFVFIMVLFWGLFATMAALIARYQGAGEGYKIGPLLRGALLLSWGLSIFIITIYRLIPFVLHAMNYNSEVITMVQKFLNAMSFATPADLMLGILYALCFGLGKPRYVLIATLAQVPVNLFLNYAFMFGLLGLPAFGLAGIGVGVACTYWLMLLFFFVVLSRFMPFKQYLWGRYLVDKQSLVELVHVGGPAGMQWLLQMGFSAFIALMMGKLSILALAAYQVTFQVYTLFFNVVYNFNQAVTIRVAEGIGQRTIKQVRYSYIASYVFIAFILLVIVLVLLLSGDSLVYFFIQKDANVAPAFLSLCEKFLWLMPLFAVFDFLCYTHFEVLRAYKDTRFPMMVALIVYWIVTMPIIYILVSLGYVKNPVILWVFMIVATCFSLVGQGLRYRYQYKNFLINI